MSDRDLSAAMRRVDSPTERADAIGGAGAPFSLPSGVGLALITDRPASPSVKAAEEAAQHVAERVGQVSRARHAADADAMSVMHRAAVRGGQAPGVTRIEDAADAREIGDILMRIYARSAEPIVAVEMPKAAE